MNIRRSLFCTDTNWKMRLENLKPSNIIKEYNLEAVHMILTWLWIFAGCFAQFLIITYHIRGQNLIPFRWKFFIVLASLALMGPTMIYAYCIFVIITFKLKLRAAPPTENDTRQILNRLLFLAGQSKLGEVLVENFPQFLTQILMTSAKGNDGERALSQLQWISVVSSALSIVMGISGHVIRTRGRYMSKNHTTVASQLVIILLIASEIAFCGGVCSFSFAFTVGSTGVPIIAALIPFLVVSSTLATVIISTDFFQWKFEGYFSLFYKLCIWLSIMVIFFTRGSIAQAFRDLEHNDSLVYFLVTMTLTSVVNFTFGFQLTRQKTDFFLYRWMNSLMVFVGQSILALPEQEVPTLHMANVVHVDKRQSRHREVIEEQPDFSATSSIVAYPTTDERGTVIVRTGHPKKEKEEEQVTMEATKDIQSHLSTMIGNENDISTVTRCANAFLESVVQQTDNQNASRLCSERENANETSMKTMKEKALKSLSTLAQSICPLFILFVFLCILGTILVYPMKFKAEPFHIEFEGREKGCKDGFPLISSTSESTKGYICIEGKSTSEVIKIAAVIARQLKMLTVISSKGKEVVKKGKTLLIGNISLNKKDPHLPKKPFLYPSCTGNEKTLAECQHYGLAVRIPEFCYERTSQLYIGILLTTHFTHEPLHPPFFHLINNTAMSLSEAYETCEQTESVTIGDLSNGSYPPSIPSHISGMYLTNAVQQSLVVHMERINITEIWRTKEELGYWKRETRQQTFLTPIFDGKVTDKRPVICAVYNRFYKTYCMRDSQAIGQPACAECIPINYMPTVIDNAACYRKPHPENDTVCTCQQFDCMPMPCNSSSNDFNLPGSMHFSHQDFDMNNLSLSDMPLLDYEREAYWEL